MVSLYVLCGKHDDEVHVVNTRCALVLLAFLDRSNIGCVPTHASVVGQPFLLTCRFGEAMRKSPAWARTCR